MLKLFRREPLFAKLPVVARKNSSGHALLALWKLSHKYQLKF